MTMNEGSATTGGQPSDADLDAVFADAVAFEVLDGPPGSAATEGARRLLAKGSAADLQALREALRIEAGGGRCMCAGDATLRVIGRDGVRATIGLHHGTSIRWSERWSMDALLASPESLANFFAAHGWRRYRESIDERKERELVGEASRGRWLGAMPPALQPLAAELSNEFGVPPRGQLERARKALVLALGSEVGAVAALFRWFGCGEGPWSGFPAYESSASYLLATFSASTIVEALAGDLDTRQLAGAARYCASRQFQRDRRKMPAALVERLRAHVIGEAHADHVGQFETAFKLGAKYRKDPE